MGRTPQDSVGGVLISLSRPWACSWINHWSLWRMASATPDLRLPSQPQGITGPLTSTKLYCLVTEAHVCEQLTQGCYLKAERPGVKPATFCVASQHPNHYTSRPQLSTQSRSKIRSFSRLFEGRKDTFPYVIASKSKRHVMTYQGSGSCHSGCTEFPEFSMFREIPDYSSFVALLSHYLTERTTDITNIF